MAMHTAAFEQSKEKKKTRNTTRSSHVPCFRSCAVLSTSAPAHFQFWLPRPHDPRLIVQPPRCQAYRRHNSCSYSSREWQRARLRRIESEKLYAILRIENRSQVRVAESRRRARVACGILGSEITAWLFSSRFLFFFLFSSFVFFTTTIISVLVAHSPHTSELFCSEAQHV